MSIIIPFVPREMSARISKGTLVSASPDARESGALDLHLAGTDLLYPLQRLAAASISAFSAP